MKRGRSESFLLETLRDGELRGSSRRTLSASVAKSDSVQARILRLLKAHHVVPLQEESATPIAPPEVQEGNNAATEPENTHETDTGTRIRAGARTGAGARIDVLTEAESPAGSRLGLGLGADSVRETGEVAGRHGHGHRDGAEDESAARNASELRNEQENTHENVEAQAQQPLAPGKIFSCAWACSQRAILAGKCGRLRVVEPKKPNAEQSLKALDWPELPSTPSASASKGGVHDLRANPSRTMLATGGVGYQYPECIGLFSIPDLKPLSCSSSVHKNWVFNLDWVTDDYLVSCSRDGSLCMWQVDNGDLSLVQHKEHAHTARATTSLSLGKVRCCRAFSSGGASTRSAVLTLAPTAARGEQLMIWSVTSSGLVHDSTWDNALVEMPTRRNVGQCVATDTRSDTLFAVDSCLRVVLIDRRERPDYNHSIKLKYQDERDSLRSLSLRDTLVTCGDASGRLFFYDTRMPKAPLPTYFKAPEALFSHEWDPDGTSLLVAGGCITIENENPFCTIYL